MYQNHPQQPLGHDTSGGRMADPADFTRQAAALVAEGDAPTRRIGDRDFPPPPRQEHVDGLRELLELTEGFSSADQRARYILTSNWFRDHGPAAAAWADMHAVWA